MGFVERLSACARESGGTFTLEGHRRLEEVLAPVRLIFAVVVVAMAVVFEPASVPAVAVVALAAAAFSGYALLAARRLDGVAAGRRLARRSLALDATLALATYLLFVGDPQAMPIAYAPVLVFQVAARWGIRGATVALSLFAAAVGLRVVLQLSLLERGELRPPLLIMWLGVGVLMVGFAREFRAAERLRVAAQRQGERVAAVFSETLEQILSRSGVAQDSATCTEIRVALRSASREGAGDLDALAGRIAWLVVTARDELGLTRREREIAALLARGCSYAQIAEELYVSQSTVRNHVHNIRTKLSLESREDVAALLRLEEDATGARSAVGPG